MLLLGRVDQRRWRALVRPARKMRAGTELELGGLEGRLVSDPVEGIADVELIARDGEDVETAIGRFGTIPLPPYIKEPPHDAERYQTVFARSLGSAAAPTAGLHFTDEVVGRLRARGIGMATISLEVGTDTFRPISTAEIGDHRMHSEPYDVPEATAEAIGQTTQRGGRIVAIGTTVVRALEAAAPDGRVLAGPGATDLFIVPGYRFRVVDTLVTNFHVPGSTLVVLVAAFAGPGWRRAYAHALARGYRFLSFGDAMLAERHS